MPIRLHRCTMNGSTRTQRAPSLIIHVSVSKMFRKSCRACWNILSLACASLNASASPVPVPRPPTSRSEHASLGTMRAWTTIWKRGRACTLKTLTSGNTCWPFPTHRDRPGTPDAWCIGWPRLSCYRGLFVWLQSTVLHTFTTMSRNCLEKTRMQMTMIIQRREITLQALSMALGVPLCASYRGSTRWIWPNLNGTFAVTSRWCLATLKPCLWIWIWIQTHRYQLQWLHVCDAILATSFRAAPGAGAQQAALRSLPGLEGTWLRGQTHSPLDLVVGFLLVAVVSLLAGCILQEAAIPACFTREASEVGWAAV